MEGHRSPNKPCCPFLASPADGDQDRYRSQSHSGSRFGPSARSGVNIRSRDVKQGCVGRLPLRTVPTGTRGNHDATRLVRNTTRPCPGGWCRKGTHRVGNWCEPPWPIVTAVRTAGGTCLRRYQLVSSTPWSPPQPGGLPCPAAGLIDRKRPAKSTFGGYSQWALTFTLAYIHIHTHTHTCRVDPLLQTRTRPVWMAVHLGKHVAAAISTVGCKTVGRTQIWKDLVWAQATLSARTWSTCGWICLCLVCAVAQQRMRRVDRRAEQVTCRYRRGVGAAAEAGRSDKSAGGVNEVSSKSPGARSAVNATRWGRLPPPAPQS